MVRDVDAEQPIPVAEGVSNQPPDCEHLAPTVERVIAALGEAHQR